jgi:hypothetical protein
MRKLLGSALITAGMLIVFLGLTNPANLSIGLLLIPFLLFGLFIYFLTNFFLAVFRFSYNDTKRQKAIGLLISLLFTNFAVLQSIGDITIQDIVLAGTITTVVIVYISKFQFSSD